MTSNCVRGFLLLLTCTAFRCVAEPAPLPTYLSFPSQVHLKPNWTAEDYGWAEFIIIGQPDRPIQLGKHWSAAATLTGVPGGMDPEDVWAKIKPSMVQGGWVFFPDARGQARTARYTKDGHNSWIMLWILGADDIRFDLVEVGPVPAALKLTLPKPAAKPEVVKAESGDFPYLPPMHGVSGGSGSHTDEPMLLDVDLDQNHHEQQVVASGYITKNYTVPPQLASPALFFAVYRDALVAAGWTIVHKVESISGVDAVIAAHYAANGRDIWAYLHGGGEALTIQVADVGADDIAKQLDRDCHVALYGIHFDFNKATLRPDSEPVLEKVLALLKARPELKLEVQGHTDNVGGDDYNMKLSDSRASSVVDWLRGKGIVADRLTAHGYGFKVPVADNGSDEGRAKNRRVELKKQGCSK